MSGLIRTVVSMDGEELRDDTSVYQETTIEELHQTFKIGYAEITISHYFDPALTPEFEEIEE